MNLRYTFTEEDFSAWNELGCTGQNCDTCTGEGTGCNTKDTCDTTCSLDWNFDGSTTDPCDSNNMNCSDDDNLNVYNSAFPAQLPCGCGGVESCATAMNGCVRNGNTGVWETQACIDAFTVSCSSGESCLSV